MGFSRVFRDETYLDGDNLTKSLVGLGFLLSSESKKNVNIEHCLISLIKESFSNDLAYDLRLLALLVNWLEIHISQVNANRLIKLIEHLNNPKASRFLAAVFEYLSDVRFKKFITNYSPKKRVQFLKSSSFLVKKNGEDIRFKNTKLIIHSKALPNRPDLIMSLSLLAKSHLYYRYRVLLGPTYRSDIIANLSIDESLSPAELARHHFTNYQTSYKAKKDFQIFQTLGIS